ncbi:hypothetical protein Bca4012_063403 [Brassica carinata]
MTTDDLTDGQSRDDGSIRDNVDNTPAANATAVNADANTAAREEMKKMFSAFEKKSEKQEKLIGTLAEQVKTLTARTQVVLPRGTTKVRGRRLYFRTRRDRPENSQENLSRHNPSNTTLVPIGKSYENPLLAEHDTEEHEVEHVDLDPSNRFENSDEDTDIHPRRTRSRAAQQDSLFDKPMNEEMETAFFEEQEKLAEEQAEITRDLRDYITKNGCRSKSCEISDSPCY